MDINTKIAALLIVAFSLGSILKAIRTFRQDKLSTRLLVMWIVIWAGISFFAVFPGFLDWIMQMVNMGNRTFFLSTGAILILFVIVFYLSSHISRLNHKISGLVQEIAILNYRLEDKVFSKTDAPEDENHA